MEISAKYQLKMKFFWVFVYVNVYAINLSHALNETCQDGDNSPCIQKEKTMCINGSCQCDNLSIYSESLTKCLSYVTEYKSLCYQDWQCQDFLGDNSQCINNACLCKDGFSWYQGQCKAYASKGETCTKDTLDCLDLNDPLSLSCIDNLCQCSSDQYYDRGQDCRLKSELDKECAISADCLPTANQFGAQSCSHCELGKCVKNDCNSTIGLLLYDEYHDEDYLTVNWGSSDILSSSLADMSEDECLEQPNTIYFKNVSCICKQGFFLLNGQCIPELGMLDTNGTYVKDADCPIKPGKLVDGVCYCNHYWFPSSTNRECKKTTLEYTKTCLDNDWCRAMGPYSFCNSETKKCECSVLATLNTTTFYCELTSSDNSTDICRADSDCPLYEKCVNEACQCTEGFFRAHEDDVCMPEIGYSCEIRNCSHIEHASCATNETCVCDDDYSITNGFVCLKEATQLDDECLLDEQCSKIPNSSCRKESSNSTIKQCMCSEDNVYVKGACYTNRVYGSPCSTRKDCTIILGNTFVCRNGLCQCPIGAKLSNDTCVASAASRWFVHAALPLMLLVLFLRNLLQ